MRTFIDSLGGLWAEGKLADKVYAAFTSSNTLHGGQETTCFRLHHLIVGGGIIVPPGSPTRASSSTATLWREPVATHDNIDELDDHRQRPDHLARRVVSVADRLAS